MKDYKRVKGLKKISYGRSFVNSKKNSATFYRSGARLTY